MSGIDGKVVAITGASSGIGEATAACSPSAAPRSCSGAAGPSGSTTSPTTPRRRRAGRHAAPPTSPGARISNGSSPGRGRVRPARRAGQQRRHQQDRPDGRPRRRRLVGDDRRQPARRAARHRRRAAGVPRAGPRPPRHHRVDGRAEDHARRWPSTPRPRTPYARCWKGCARSRPTACCGRPRSRPGYVRTELADSIDDPARPRADPPKAWTSSASRRRPSPARSPSPIEQPHDVEIGDITIRPTVQN